MENIYDYIFYLYYIIGKEEIECNTYNMVVNIVNLIIRINDNMSMNNFKIKNLKDFKSPIWKCFPIVHDLVNTMYCMVSTNLVLELLIVS